MLNWDDYNESENTQKTQPVIKEEKPVEAQTSQEVIEESIPEHILALVGDRAMHAKQAIEVLDTKEGEEELEGLAG